MTNRSLRSSSGTVRGLAGRGDAVRHRFWVAVAFVILVALTGGGSRSDIASIPTLRGLSVLFAAYALWVMPDGALRAVRLPLLVLGALATWMVVQMIPLPVDWWSALPGRDIVHQIDILLGQADLARPISLTPSLTVNSLLSLVVPLAAILLFSMLSRDDMSRLCLVVIGVAVVSAFIGMLQVWLSGPNALYLYRITNQGSMVGLFSNRNHHAVFLACALVLVAAAQRQALLEKARQPLSHIAFLFAGLMMVVVTIAIGSRGGLVAGLIALATYAALVLPPLLQFVDAPPAAQLGNKYQRQTEQLANGRPRPLRRIVVMTLPLIAFAALALLFAWSEQNNAINRSFGLNYADDLRGQTLPVVLDLISSHWLLGSGYGSFAAVYASVEPDALLQPQYFNHAHNDWGQLLIEGGLPMALIVAAGFSWIAIRVGRMLIGGLRTADRDSLALGLALASITLIFAASSLGDYPLRTPSLMVFAVLAVVVMVRLDSPLPEGPGTQELV